MRQYEPIWSLLKKHNRAAITASTHLHRRIIQAVRKERANDRGWRYLIAEDKRRVELKVTITGKIIQFELIDLEYIPTLADL